MDGITLMLECTGDDDVEVLQALGPAGDRTEHGAVTGSGDSGAYRRC